MNEKILKELIINTINTEEHLGENLKKQCLEYFEGLQQRIDKALEYMKDFTFEPLLTNEDRKLIMYNANLRNFERILKGESYE